MADKIYYNSSALFKVRDKKSEKAPDYNATIQLDSDTLDAIVKSGGKIRVAGWLREGAKGKFVSLMLTADDYVKPDSTEANDYSKHDDNISPF